MACSHPENRINLTKMDEWPEWILEILISNYEVDFLCYFTKNYFAFFLESCEE